MDIEVIVALVGIFGVFVAAVLSSAGYLYRASTDAKRSARTVLYFLLEIRHALALSLIDPSDATKKYFEYYARRLNENGIEQDIGELSSAMFPLLYDYFEKLISSMKTDMKTRLLEPYENSLMEFAAVNPVLAYQLRGKEKLEALVAVSNVHHSRVNAEVIEAVDIDWAKSVLAEFAEDVRTNNFTTITKQLDDDIIVLARHCGRRDLKMCKAVYANSLNEENKYDFSEIDDWIDKLIARVVEAARKQEERPVNKTGPEHER